MRLFLPLPRLEAKRAAPLALSDSYAWLGLVNLGFLSASCAVTAEIFRLSRSPASLQRCRFINVGFVISFLVDFEFMNF